MDNDDDPSCPPGSHEFFLPAFKPEQLFALRNGKNWYDGDDPVVREVVSAALEHLAKSHEVDETEEDLKRAVQHVSEWVNSIKTGHQEEDADGKLVWVDDDMTLIDAVDRIMSSNWEFPCEVTLEDVLMLLTLSAAKENLPALAMKAFQIGKAQRTEQALRQERQCARDKSTRDRAKQAKGGKAPTRLKGVFEATKQLVRKNPKDKKCNYWRQIPDSEHLAMEIEVDGSEYGVYRDSIDTDHIDTKSKVYQKELLSDPDRGPTGTKIRSIQYNSWCDYVPDARKELRSN
jgi:hypothetical protein